jgi:ABC-type arginine transport system permease subunit
MDEPTFKSDTSPGKPLTAQQMASTSPDVAAEKPASEARQAYGTAKTENLRDSGLWRFLLPAFVVLCCLAVLAIPLIILIPLLSNSFNPSAAANAAGHPLSWLWIVMIVIILGIATVIIRGLIKIFMTQAGNYRS